MIYKNAHTTALTFLMLHYDLKEKHAKETKNKPKMQAKKKKQTNKNKEDTKQK